MIVKSNPHLHLYIVLVLASLVFWGCNTRAKVELQPGASAPAGVRAIQDGHRQVIHAPIVDSNEREFFFEGVDGKLVAVPRADVESIEHPGEVTEDLGIGFTVGGLGIAGIFGGSVALAEGDGSTGLYTIPLLLGGAVTVLGLGIWASGAAANSESRKAAEAEVSAAPIMHRGPDGKTAYGAGLQIRW